uniref:Uncharacterized protein n=1 Tax=Oryza punctata TaxID=4537 RepID=A0A0E0LG91_ORYPU
MAAVRRMVAPRRAFCSGSSSKRIIVEKEQQQPSYLLPPRGYLEGTRDSFLRYLEHFKEQARIHSNPFLGPADGNIAYANSWRLNLAVLFCTAVSVGWNEAGEDAKQLRCCPSSPS